MLASAVVTEFQRKYPACDSTRALELLNKVHRELATRSQFRNTTVTISLTASTAEYDLSSAVYMIHEAYYEITSDPADWRQLVERSLDEFIVKRFGWRQNTDSTSEPTEYYITSATDSNTSKATIGFWPVPDTTTSGGYPRVRLYTTSVVDLIGTDAIPPQCINSNVYLYGMYKLWSFDKAPQDYSMNRAVAEDEMDKNVAHIKGLQTHKDTQILPNAILTRTRVV